MSNLKNLILGAGVAVALMASCSGNQTLSGLNPTAFDTTINGKKVARPLLLFFKNASTLHSHQQKWYGSLHH
mgnify:CR=1 FL=1